MNEEQKKQFRIKLDKITVRAIRYTVTQGQFMASVHESAAGLVYTGEEMDEITKPFLDRILSECHFAFLVAGQRIKASDFRQTIEYLDTIGHGEGFAWPNGRWFHLTWHNAENNHE